MFCRHVHLDSSVSIVTALRAVRSGFASRLRVPPSRLSGEYRAVSPGVEGVGMLVFRVRQSGNKIPYVEVLSVTYCQRQDRWTDFLEILCGRLSIKIIMQF